MSDKVQYNVGDLISIVHGPNAKLFADHVFKVTEVQRNPDRTHDSLTATLWCAGNMGLTAFLRSTDVAKHAL